MCKNTGHLILVRQTYHLCYNQNGKDSNLLSICILCFNLLQPQAPLSVYQVPCYIAV